MFIHYIPKYMALSFYWNKNKWEIIYKFVFLIVVALSGITFLNFEN